MNYLSGALRYVAGSESDQRDAIPRLIDRIKTSALPQDRRAAITALVDSAKHSPNQQVLVGELGIKLIYAVLEQDKEFDDTVKATLDLLIAICGTLDTPPPDKLPSVLGDSTRGKSPQYLINVFQEKTSRAASTNVDMFLGLPNSVSLILDLLEKSDFYVKFSAIELLSAMAANSRHTLQLAVLEAPQGVSRICDLLDDNQTLLRSNAVLLLSTLCDQSTEICKIVAYGGVLEKLFAIAESAVSDRSSMDTLDDDDDDDELEGAIIVQDVLLVVRNLIRGANTTKTFIRDTGCLPRLIKVLNKSAADSGILAQLSAQPIQASTSKSQTGRKAAVSNQARANLHLAMHCLTDLVKDGDSETKLIKNDLTTTNVFDLLSELSFYTSVVPGAERGIQVQVASLRTLSMLVRGHDKFRTMFCSLPLSKVDNTTTISAQVAALQSMLGDPSPAVRAASYCALRESFVVDAVLDLPSSNLLHAMAGSASGGYTIRDRGSAKARQIPQNNSIQYIADSLKAAVIGWPGDADPAGVFYSASLMTWILASIQDGKEKMLSAKVNGNQLLPQMIRLLGRVQRENGPPPVRISLYALVCSWLHESSTSVSAFLSAAMNLPMLVDVLQGSGSRGDIAEIHVRGLASVVLGICLQETDKAAVDEGVNSTSIPGRGRSLFAIPRGTISDVIRNRVGITAFTSCLDDLRASKPFSIDNNSGLWSFAETYSSAGNESALETVMNDLGHQMWYSKSIIRVIDHVYQDISSKALDLIANQPSAPVLQPNGIASASGMNGHSIGTSADRDLSLEDSARDEVLNSYKEFIRSQDESLSAARRQIDELSTALRESQRELDAKTNEETAISRNQNSRKEFEELQSQNEALEALLEEKTADFVSLHEAFAALEEEHNLHVGEASTGGLTHNSEEVTQLQNQLNRLKGSLNAEVMKNNELSYKTSHFEGMISAKDVELNSLRHEVNQLRAGVQPDFSEALGWKTELEVAKAKLSSNQSDIQHLQRERDGLTEQLHSKNDSVEQKDVRISTLEMQLESSRAELNELKATRKRELQIAKESSIAAAATAEDEIKSLKSKLALKATSDSSQKASHPAQDSSQLKQLQDDHQALKLSHDQMSTQLLDAQNAQVQWQQRAEKAEELREKEIQENHRLSKLVRDLGAKVQALSEEVEAQTDMSKSSTSRVTELEDQIAQLEHMREETSEEMQGLKQELAARTEQTIRLSGQLYEATEGRTDVNVEKTEGSEELLSKIGELENELGNARDALADAKDRESLMRAQTRDREDAVEKIAVLEKEIAGHIERENNLKEEVVNVKERLLLLDEAENAKRALTMQVVELQKSLAAAGDPTSQGENTLQKQQSTEDDAKLRNELAEKELRLSQLETALTEAMDRLDSVEKEKLDHAKQISENEATMSVIHAEREELRTRCEKLERDLEERAPYSELDKSVVEDYQKKIAVLQGTLSDVEGKLEDAEKSRTTASTELMSLVEACRMSETEMKRTQTENENLRAKILEQEAKVETLTTECAAITLSGQVQAVVDSISTEAAARSTHESSNELIESMRNERDTAIDLKAQSDADLKNIKVEVDALSKKLKDYEEMTVKLLNQENQLSEQAKQLGDLDSIINDKDRLEQSLQAANDSVCSLTEEKNELIKLIEQAKAQILQDPVESTRDIKEGATHTPPVIASPTRVTELENALRDAARTVTATNRDLIAAQVLLVELSADKTAMRTDLVAAQEEIKRLNARDSVDRHTHPGEATLSEVSEQDQAPAFSASRTEHRNEEEEVVEQSLSAAHAEIENLHTIMHRSVSEAKSASSLLVSVTSKIEQLENRLQSTRSSLADSRSAEEELRAQLSVLRASYESEKSNLMDDIRASKTQVSEIQRVADSKSQDLNKKLTKLEESRNTEREALEASVTNKQNQIESINKTLTELNSKLADVTTSADRYSQEVQVLESSNKKYSLDIVALEAEIASANRNLNESEKRERDLTEKLNLYETEMRNKEETFINERNTLNEQLKRDAKDFEDEIDRSSKALEEAERQFRRSELALKSKISDLEESKGGLKAELRQRNEELQSIKQQLSVAISETTRVNSELENTREELENKLATLTIQKDEALASLDVTTKDRDATSARLAKAFSSLESLRLQLRNEQEQKENLKTENKSKSDLISNLEALCSDLEGDLSAKKRELYSKTSKCEKMEGIASDQGKVIDELQESISGKDDEISEQREILSKLKKERSELRDNFESISCAKEALEEDNKDLKLWVEDLERQATELQNAADNFEEIEMNLREALESQRGIAEQNKQLSEELKKERESTSNAELQTRIALREKIAAEGARESSQKRVIELEERIKMIRGEHLMKFSNSEDAIRSKAMRCAELETELAAANRKVAELAGVSDLLFGARAELSQAEEDMASVRNRAEAAESRVEELELKLHSYEVELSEVRESGTGDAYKILEAEHNELLVCLAEMEVECTMLKEELGRE